MAINYLSEGKVPKATSLSEDHFIFEYKFTGEVNNSQTFTIEITDYSGELNSLKIAHDNSAKKLREKLSKMDGFLVLAEAPFKSEVETGDLYEKLSELRQTFSLLRDDIQKGAVLDIPVALVINKWDRYSDIDYEHPEKEYHKLEELLSLLNSPHKSIYDELKSSVTEGNFKTFPVSALGPNELVQIENGERVELPKQTNPLQCFGLENPFIWLVERHNAISVKNYLDKGIKNKRCQATGKKLLNRFPP